MPPSSLGLRGLERWAITAAIERTGRNLAESARLLRIGRRTLYRKIKECTLADDEASEGPRVRSTLDPPPELPIVTEAIVTGAGLVV